MANLTTQKLQSAQAPKLSISDLQGKAGNKLLANANTGPGKVMDAHGGFHFGNVQTGQDLVKSMITDRQAEITATEQDEARQREALSLQNEGLQKATSGLRQTAQSSLDRSNASLDRYESQGAANVEEIQQRSRELANTANARRGEDIAAFESNKYDVMQGFQDDTATAIQSQRISNKANMETEIDNIIQQAAANGLDPSDPQVQAQVQQVRNTARATAGQIAGQASTQYNTAKAQLGSTMASLGASVRQATSASAGRGEEQAVAGLVSAEQLQQKTREALISSRQTAEMSALQVFAAADQLEFSGAGQVADFMRNMTSSYSPIAPIIATSMVEAEEFMSQELGAFANGAGGVRFADKKPIWAKGGQQIQNRGGQKQKQAPSGQYDLNKSTAPGLPSKSPSQLLSG